MGISHWFLRLSVRGPNVKIENFGTPRKCSDAVPTVGSCLACKSPNVTLVWHRKSVHDATWCEDVLSQLLSFTDNGFLVVTRETSLDVAMPVPRSSDASHWKQTARWHSSHTRSRKYRIMVIILSALGKMGHDVNLALPNSPWSKEGADSKLLEN